MKDNQFYPISLGHNCIPAHHLSVLGLRKQSLPFDWLLSPSYLAIDYATELINTNFKDFLTDLKYNEQNIVISGKYPEVKFWHHDLLKKKSNLEQCEDNYILTFQRRAKRFLEIITHENIFFINVFQNRHANLKKEAKFFWGSVDNFAQVLRQKNVKFQLLIIIYDNIDFDFDKIVKPINLPANVHLRQFIRDTNINQYFGCEKAFGKIIQEFFPYINQA